MVTNIPGTMNMLPHTIGVCTEICIFSCNNDISNISYSYIDDSGTDSSLSSPQEMNQNTLITCMYSLL